MYKIEINDEEFDLLQFLVWTYTGYDDISIDYIKKFFKESGFSIKNKRYFREDIKNLWEKIVVTKNKQEV